MVNQWDEIYVKFLNDEISFIIYRGESKYHLEKQSHSYFGDGLQQTEVDVDKTIKVFIGKPEAFHVKLHLTTISQVRDLVGQKLIAQDQGVVPHKVLKHELLSWQSKKKVTK